MATDFWKQRLARIAEQFSQCEPVELVMIREENPVGDAARKAALASIIDGIAEDSERRGQLQTEQPIPDAPVSIEELARRHVRQDRIKAKMLAECRGFGSRAVEFGSLYFYAPSLLTIPPDDANRVWKKLDEMFNAAGSALEVVPASVQSQLSPLAMSFDDRKFRWAGCLFDIALRRLPGMTHTEPTYLQGQEPTHDRPNQGCYSSTIKNVMASSVELIDWLISAADVPNRETEVTNEPLRPPTDSSCETKLVEPETANMENNRTVKHVPTQTGLGISMFLMGVDAPPAWERDAIAELSQHEYYRNEFGALGIPLPSTRAEWGALIGTLGDPALLLAFERGEVSPSALIHCFANRPKAVGQRDTVVLLPADQKGELKTPKSPYRWNVLADGLDPIIEALEGFDGAAHKRLMSLKWLHHSSSSISSLFADVWNKTCYMDVGPVPRYEAVRVTLQQLDLVAVASEVDERRRNLIESLKTWQEQARSTVEWNEHTITVLKQIPYSGGIEWPESEKPELNDYLGEDHSDSLHHICGEVAKLATYLKWQHDEVTRRIAQRQQSDKTTPPVDLLSGTLAGGDGESYTQSESNGDTDSKPMKSRALYEWAIHVIPGADEMSIKELHDAIQNHPKASTELLEFLPDKWQTFGTYLKRAGVDRYDSKGSRQRRQSRRHRQ